MTDSEIYYPNIKQEDKMSEQTNRQGAYDICQTVMSLNKKFHRGRIAGMGEIEGYLNAGATKNDIMAWLLRGEARGTMVSIIGGAK
jgi:hypothetical protein